MRGEQLSLFNLLYQIARSSRCKFSLCTYYSQTGCRTEILVRVTKSDQSGYNNIVSSLFNIYLISMFTMPSSSNVEICCYASSVTVVELLATRDICLNALRCCL